MDYGKHNTCKLEFSHEAMAIHPLLHIVIQFGDNVLAEFFEKYLQQVIQNYLTYKKSFDSQFKKWLEMGMDMSEIVHRSFENMNPLQSIFGQFSDPSKAGKKKK